jgi:hypothetical protein
MKKMLILSLLFFSLGIHAQTDSTNALTDTSQIKFIEPPDSTGFGTPYGQLVSKEIGPTGGTIISEDGKVELIFPAEALTANTNISIQPITNLAPNGAGKAYQFEPSGIQFKKPVQIIFHYSDEEAETCPPDLMAFAIQDHKGKWSFFDYEDWDSIGKALKGVIQHFSGLSNVNKLQLTVDKKSIKVNGRTSIEIVDISQKWGKEVAGTSYEGQYVLGRVGINNPILWYVNGIENGNSSIGSVVPYTDPTSDAKAKLLFAIFTAPQYLPKQNPAFIRADVYVFSGKKKVFYRARSLRCKVEIYDEYVIDIDVRGPSILDCKAKLRDAAVLHVKLYPKKIEFVDIQNYPVVLTDQATCDPLKYDPTDCVGPVHVRKDKLKSYQIKNYPPEVTIEFSEFIVTIMKSNGKFRGEINKFPTSEVSVNVGNLIRFIADHSLKIQEVTFGSGEDSYTVTIMAL